MEIIFPSFSFLFFNSTPSFSKVFGEITTLFGIPIKSESPNFSPGLLSLSSQRTSIPFS